MPEKKVHVTSLGEKMRSKNEVLHAEVMYRNHIPFRYEPVIHIGTITLILDFAAMRIRDAKFFYAEHCGMPHNKEYMARHKRKMELYESVEPIKCVTKKTHKKMHLAVVYRQVNVVK